MRNKKRRLKRRLIEYSIKISVLFVILMVLGGGGYVAYAKYFAESARWGIAIASQVYFTANYAAENENEEYFESVVYSAYDGKSYTFAFEVRNHENNLLFNPINVDIPYTVSFWLAEEPVDATYQVTWNETILEIGVGKENCVSYTATIEGGSAFADKYGISITVPDSKVHTPVPIYVEVQTDASAVIDKTLRGKMVLNSGGTAKKGIESKRFVLSDRTVEDISLEDIEKLSMLTYEIRTVGDLSGESTDTLKLSWNPDYLEIDLFDEAYMDWLEKENGKSDDDAAITQPYSETIEDVTWYYITLEVMPYSSQTINFLRGNNYNTITDLPTLESYVKVEYLSTGEGSE